MSDEMDDVIDVLLRKQFNGPVLNGDFCDQVMQQLPTRRHPWKWPLVVGITAGVAACWFSLWSTPILQDGWWDWLSGVPSASAIVVFIAMLGMAMLALAWAVDEAAGRARAWFG